MQLDHTDTDVSDKTIILQYTRGDVDFTGTTAGVDRPSEAINLDRSPLYTDRRVAGLFRDFNDAIAQING